MQHKHHHLLLLLGLIVVANAPTLLVCLGINKMDESSCSSSDSDSEHMEREAKDDEEEKEFEKALLVHALSIENIPLKNDLMLPNPALSKGKEETPKSVEESLEDYF